MYHAHVPSLIVNNRIITILSLHMHLLIKNTINNNINTINIINNVFFDPNVNSQGSYNNIKMH